MFTSNLECMIERTKDNYDILRVEVNGKKIYLGSKYNMKNEIDKFLENLKDANDENIFFICGFASGEHIKALRQKYPQNCIIVFEPIEKLRSYINQLDWVEKDNNLHILFGDKDEAISIFLENIDVFNYKYVKILIYNRYMDIVPNQLKEFMDFVRGLFFNIRISHNTQLIESKRWFKTLMENLNFIIEGIPLNAYEEFFKDKPAIIVSAGPSLDKNIDELKVINNDFILFTGGRNLDGLLERNIKPDFLTVIDPEDIIYELSKKSLRKVSSIPLIFYEGTNEKVVKNHVGKKIYYTYSSMVRRIAGEDVLAVSTGGSVAHTCASVAAIMGCNPIIFVGQDLAYTGDKSYSSSAENKDGTWKYDEVKRDTDIIVESFGGGKVKTSLTFDVFRQNMERIIRNNEDICFVNATEGGARIKGTVEMTLKEAIKKYSNGKINYNNRNAKPCKGARKRTIDELDKVKKVGKIIEKNCTNALNNIKRLEKLDEIKNSNEINGILKKIDKIDANIKKNYIDVSLINTLLYPVICHILGTNSGEKDYNSMIEENKKLYNGLLEQIKYALNYIENIEKDINKKDCEEYRYE